MFSDFMLTDAQVYWSQVDWALKPDTGAGVIQCITIPESRKSHSFKLLFVFSRAELVFHFDLTLVENLSIPSVICPDTSVPRTNPRTYLHQQCLEQCSK